MSKIRFKRGRQVPSSLTIGRVDVSQYEGYTESLSKYFQYDKEDYDEDTTIETTIEITVQRTSGKTRRWVKKSVVVEQKKKFEEINRELDYTIHVMGEEFAAIRRIVSSSPILREHVGFDVNSEITRLQAYYMDKAKEVTIEKYNRVLVTKINSLWLVC